MCIRDSHSSVYHNTMRTSKKEKGPMICFESEYKTPKQHLGEQSEKSDSDSDSDGKSSARSSVKSSMKSGYTSVASSRFCHTSNYNSTC